MDKLLKTNKNIMSDAVVVFKWMKRSRLDDIFADDKTLNSEDQFVELVSEYMTDSPLSQIKLESSRTIKSIFYRPVSVSGSLIFSFEKGDADIVQVFNRGYAFDNKDLLIKSEKEIIGGIFYRLFDIDLERFVDHPLKMGNISVSYATNSPKITISDLYSVLKNAPGKNIRVDRLACCPGNVSFEEALTMILNEPIKDSALYASPIQPFGGDFSTIDFGFQVLTDTENTILGQIYGQQRESAGDVVFSWNENEPEAYTTIYGDNKEVDFDHINQAKNEGKGSQDGFRRFKPVIKVTAREQISDLIYWIAGGGNASPGYARTASTSTTRIDIGDTLYICEEISALYFGGSAKLEHVRPRNPRVVIYNATKKIIYGTTFGYLYGSYPPDTYTNLHNYTGSYLTSYTDDIDYNKIQDHGSDPYIYKANQYLGVYPKTDRINTGEIENFVKPFYTINNKVFFASPSCYRDDLDIHYVDIVELRANLTTSIRWTLPVYTANPTEFAISGDEEHLSLILKKPSGEGCNIFYYDLTNPIFESLRSQPIDFIRSDANEGTTFIAIERDNIHVDYQYDGFILAKGAFIYITERINESENGEYEIKEVESSDYIYVTIDAVFDESDQEGDAHSYYTFTVQESERTSLISTDYPLSNLHAYYNRIICFAGTQVFRNNIQMPSHPDGYFILDIFYGDTYGADLQIISKNIANEVFISNEFGLEGNKQSLTLVKKILVSADRPNAFIVADNDNIYKLQDETGSTAVKLLDLSGAKRFTGLLNLANSFFKNFHYDYDGVLRFSNPYKRDNVIEINDNNIKKPYKFDLIESDLLYFQPSDVIKNEILNVDDSAEFSENKNIFIKTNIDIELSRLTMKRSGDDLQVEAINTFNADNPVILVFEPGDFSNFVIDFSGTAFDGLELTVDFVNSTLGDGDLFSTVIKKRYLETSQNDQETKVDNVVGDWYEENPIEIKTPLMHESTAIYYKDFLDNYFIKDLNIRKIAILDIIVPELILFRPDGTRLSQGDIFHVTLNDLGYTGYIIEDGAIVEAEENSGDFHAEQLYYNHKNRETSIRLVSV